MNVASFFPGFQSKRSHPARAARAGTPAWAGTCQRFQRYSSPAPAASGPFFEVANCDLKASDSSFVASGPRAVMPSRWSSLPGALFWE